MEGVHRDQHGYSRVYIGASTGTAGYNQGNIEGYTRVILRDTPE